MPPPLTMPSPLPLPASLNPFNSSFEPFPFLNGSLVGDALNGQYSTALPTWSKWAGTQYATYSKWATPAMGETPFDWLAKVKVPTGPKMATVLELEQQIAELREHLGWAHDSYSFLLAYPMATYQQTQCMQQALTELVAAAPETVPKFVLDWFYVLHFAQGIVWQMWMTTLMTPVSGFRHGEGIFRTMQQYLTLYWQSLASRSTGKFGVYSPWKFVTQSTIDAALPG